MELQERTLMYLEITPENHNKIMSAQLITGGVVLLLNSTYRIYAINSLQVFQHPSIWNSDGTVFNLTRE